MVNDQREAQIPFYVFIFIFNSLHVSSTSCSSSGETNFLYNIYYQIVSIQRLVTVNLHWWPYCVQVGSELHTVWPPTQIDSYRRLYWHNLSLLMMSTRCSKQVES